MVSVPGAHDCDRADSCRLDKRCDGWLDCSQVEGAELTARIAELEDGELDVPLSRPDEPHRVDAMLIADFYREMGFDPDRFERTTRIDITPNGIRVTRLRLNENGRPYVVGKSAATEITDVAIDWANYEAQKRGGK